MKRDRIAIILSQLAAFMYVAAQRYLIFLDSGRYIVVCDDPSGRAVSDVGLRPLACWDCGSESRRGHGCLSLVSVVFCQIEDCASG